MANADGHYRRMFDMQTLGFIDDDESLQRSGRTRPPLPAPAI